MIKANELRVGDWVTDWKGNNIIISSISKGEIELRLYKEPELFAIPLTPEILEKCGFVEPKNREDVFVKGRLQIWKECVYLIEEDTIKAHFIPVRMQYLHQLQNLYFALTGEELSIQL